MGSLLSSDAVNSSKAPGSNRPNKSISSLAFANSDTSPFTDFDYEYMKLMANRGQPNILCLSENPLVVFCCRLHFQCYVSLYDYFLSVL